MRRLHFRQFVVIALMSLCVTAGANATPADKDEINQVLADIGAGPAEVLKNRLITDQITVLDKTYRALAVAALPAPILTRRITEGKLFQRVETILNQVINLHGRNGKLELFLFQDDVPQALLWRGSVLALSDGLAAPLYDGELAGIFAHELGHSYFEDELAAARQAQDARAQRIVELKCDAVALVSLKLLAYDPTHFLRGLRRIQVIKQRKSLSSGIIQSHPELVVRAQFSERFIKSLG